MSDTEVFTQQPTRAQSIVARMKAEDESSIGRNMTAAQSVNPDEHAAALRVAALHGIDVNAARSALRGGLKPKQDAAKDQARVDDPVFRAWLTDPDNAALASDAMNETRKLSDAMKKTRGALGPSFADDLIRAGGDGARHLDQMVRNLRVNMGWIDPDTAADEAEAVAANLQARQAGYTEETKAQQSEIEAAQGFFPTLGAFLTSPRAAATEIVSSTVSSSPALIAGGLTGGIGLAVGPATAIGAAAAGNFAVETAIESGAWFDAALKSRGYDPTNAVSLRAAYKDSALMSDAWAESMRKGAGTALIDTASLFLAGARVSGARGLIRKAVAGGRELGEQAVLGAGSEVVGQAAAFKGDVSRIDWKDVALESAAGVGQQAGQIGMGTILRRASMSDDGAVQAKAAVKAAAQGAEAITKADALNAAKEAYLKTPVAKRSPERVWTLMGGAAADGGVTEVRIPREVWDKHWSGQNISPATAAARVFFGGDEAYHASATSGEIVFPVGPYMDKVGPTPAWDALLPDARLSSDSEMTANEGAAEFEAREEAFKEVAKEQTLFQSELEKLEEESAALTEEIKAAESAAPDVERKALGEELEALRAEQAELEAAPQKRADQVYDLRYGATDQPPTAQPDPARLAAVEKRIEEIHAALKGQVADVDSKRARQKEIAARITQIMGERETARVAAVGVEARLEAMFTAAGEKPRTSKLAAGFYRAILSTLAQRSGVPIESLASRLEQVRAATEADVAEAKAAGEEKPRGALKIIDKAMQIVRYFGADRTTLFHEGWHFGFELLFDLAQQPAVSESIKADVQATLDHFGVTTPSEMTADHKEMLAKAGERYLFDGKAPSPALRRLFSAIRDIFVKAYKVATRLGEPISDEMRGIFDRLVATDEEIAQARYEAGADLTLPPEVVSQMEPDAQAAYYEALNAAQDKEREDLGKEILQAVTKERLEAFRARVDEEAPKIRKEIEGSPVGQAHAAIRSGKLPKLNKAQAEALLDKRLYDGLLKADLLSETGGALDATAALLDMTPHALASGLLTVENAEAVSRRVAAERVEAQSPDLVTEPERKRLARKAAASDERARVLQIEEAALAAAAGITDADRRAARDSVRPLSEIREEVERDLARTPMSLINPKASLGQARRSASQAFKHATAENWRAAKQAKENERYNFERARIGAAMKERARVHAGYMAGMNGETRQRRLGKAGPSYQGRMNDVLYHYGLRDRGSESADPRKAMDDWIKARSDEDSDGRAPSFTSAVIAGERQPWGNLTLAEMEAVRGAAQQIWEMAKADEKLLLEQGQRTIDELAAQSIAAMKAQVPNAPFKRDSRFAETPEERKSSKWQSLAGALKKVPEIVRQADNEKDGGPLWSVLVNPINHGFDWLRVQYLAAAEKRAALKKAAFTPSELKDLHVKRKIDGVREPVSMADALGVLQNLGNEGNSSRLIETYNDKGVRVSGNFTQAEVAAILREFGSQEMADFVQGKFDLFESYWEQVKQQEVDVTGLAPEKVEATPITFTTKDGKAITMRGGYFPIVYGDPRGEEMTEAQKAQAIGQAASSRAMTAHGHTEARMQNVDRPLLLDPNLDEQALNQMLYDLAFRKALIDANRFLNHRGTDSQGRSYRDVRQAIIDHFGKAAYDQIRALLKDIATNDTRFYEQGDWFVARLRRGTSAALLGGKISTALVNTTGIAQSVNRIGGKDGNANGAMWLKKAVERLANPKEAGSLVAFVMERSRTLPHRTANLTREIAERAKLSGGDPKRSKVDAFNYYLYGRTQVFVDSVTWYAAYLKAMDANPYNEQKAIDIAESVVRESQGSGDLIDLAAFQRGSEWKKWASLFYHYASTTLARTNASWSQLRVRDPETYARFLADNLVLFIIPSIFAYAIKQALGKLRGDRDEEPVAKGFAKELFANVINLIPLLRQGTSLVYTGEAKDPNMKAVESIGKAAVEVWEGMPGTKGHFDVGKFLKGMNMATGIWYEYGADQINRSVEGMAAWIDGKKGAGPQSLILGPPRGR